MADNRKDISSLKKKIIHASCGTVVIFAWYLSDRILYDASVGTIFQRVFDVLYFVIFLPLHSAWQAMYKIGMLPLSDYAYELYLYYAAGGIYLVCLGGWIGLFTAAVIKKIMKP